MNIIIGQDKYVRLTQYSNQATYNLEDIVFYISKTLTYTEAFVQLKKGLNNYLFLLEETTSITNEFYKVYKVIFTQNVSLSSNVYSVNIKLDTDVIFIGNISLNKIFYTAPTRMLFSRMAGPQITLPYGLSDNHDPIDIIDRTMQINKNQNTIIVGDNISQVIRFRIARYQDNIDILSKEIYIDYRLVDSIDINSELIKSDTINIEEIDGIEYCVIPWVITSPLTQKEGQIQFAISITDPYSALTIEENDNGEVIEAQRYVWQTFPAFIIIQRGLGKDFDNQPIPPEGTDEYTKLLKDISALSNKVNNLDYVETVTKDGTFTLVDQNGGAVTESEVTLQELLTNSGENEEIIFSGGGALG